MHHARIFSGPDAKYRVLRMFRPAEGAAFVLLGDQAAIFHEAGQKIYALNQTAAYIWCCVEEGKTIDQICDDLARSGTHADAARQYVRQAVASWLRLGVLRAECDPAAADIQANRAFNIRLAHFSATLRAADAHAARLQTAFGRHAVPAGDVAQVLRVIEDDDGLVHVFHNEFSVICCDPDELVPAIRAYLTEQVVTVGGLGERPGIAFHAACLERGGRNLLISGAPGAGKTTLAARLTHSGFGYGGDDVVLITPDGQAAGVPLAPAVKSGAWGMVREFYPDLDHAEVHRRPDGKSVRYLDLPQQASDARHPVGWIVFIRRTGGPANLKPLAPMEALSLIMEGSYFAGGRTDRKTFKSLVRAVASASVFELTFSDLNEANDAIVRLCDG